ncbi:peptidylprolyl isomerase [Peribacillus psychrosaccharolyticus]|uniref:Foldase protein PrsA n=2 Tax=Peribacillus psychrosaccharolyticus TaxID=1407 RepID=A0A974NJD6_PERPY|nr:peptidylprolyl isomerase [Peribacillus psychrosaccharolyticus]MED3744549.1 peptidylprolyl isomerase [Peribacillus psychrosaccharolyticus]QQS98672.1 peptidylprolyl isomerase [Peribacillus psychrosaccharolyticus]
MKDSWKKPSTYVWIAGILVVGALIFLLITFTSSAKGKAVATIDGEEITKDELYENLVSQYGASALSTMISDKIVDLEAKKEDIKITDKEIDKEMKTLIESYGDEETFEQQLATTGATKSTLEKDIVKYLQTVKLLEPRIKISDEEINTYFKENKDSLAQEEQVEASHILVESKAEAKDIIEKLADGKKFADLAKEYSTDTASAEKGGELGFFGKGEMAEEFEKVAFSLEKGKISDPVKTSYGYHIIKVTDKKAAKKANLKDSKTEIVATLKNEKLQTEYTTWLTEKQKDYDIYNSLESETETE